MHTHIETITSTTVTLDEDDLTKLVKEHLKLEGAVAVNFDISSGGLFRTMTLIQTRRSCEPT